MKPFSRLLESLALSMTLSAASIAQIVTDGSVGAARQLNGPDFMIPDSLGSQRGSNLFHSFSQFGIGSGESATFTSSYAGETQNIISRITGASPSIINGRLASTIPGADLWLINPNGVMFGAESSLDLLGGLHVATASYVALQDGGRYGADLTDPGSTLLTTAPVSAFGFLSAPEAVALDAQLEVGTGQTLRVAAGDINITGQLEAPSGRVSLVAIGSEGELALSPDGRFDSASVEAFATLADVDIQSVDGRLARIRANGASAGSIYIRGDSFLLDGFVGSIANEGEADHARVDIDARERIAIGTGSSDAFLITAALGSGDAASLSIAAPEITIAEEAVVTAFVGLDASGDGGDIAIAAERLHVVGSVSTATNGSGDAGNVNISGYSSANAEGVSVIGDAAFVSADSGAFMSPAEGDAGDISISAHSLVIDSNNGGIFADAQNARAGKLVLNVDAFTLRQGTVSASVVAGGGGEAGSVDIRGIDSSADSVSAARTVSIVRGNGVTAQGSRAPASINSAGGAGAITVTASHMEVLDGGVISISNFDQPGEGGAITLNVDYLEVGAVDSGTVADPSLITSATAGIGNAGDILVQGVGSIPGNVRPSRQVSLSDQFGGLSADSFSGDSDAGAAGSITLHTERLVIQNAAGIGSTNAGGASGAVTLNVDSLTVSDNASISTLTVGTASAGDIHIQGLSSSEAGVSPAGEVLITRGSVVGGNPIGEAGGAGGTITVRADSLTVSDGARIDVGGFSSTSAGGDIILFANTVRIDGAQVLADSIGGGVAGSILVAGSASSVDAPASAEQVSLVNVAQLLSSASGVGSGAGTAGDVVVLGEVVSVTGGSEISATTADGVGGSVLIAAGLLEVSGAGKISTSTTGLADGGDLSLRVDSLQLDSGSIEANSDPNTGRFRFYQRFVQGPDASLESVLEPGGVLFASVLPTDLGAPDVPFLFFVELAPTTAGVLWATNLEIGTVPANTTSNAPGVAEIRGASDGSIPIQLLLTGITDTDFVGAHNEAGPLSVNLQFLEAGEYDFGDGGSIDIRGRDNAATSAISLSGDSRITSSSSGAEETITPAGLALPGLVFDVTAGSAGEIQIASDSLALSDAALISAGTIDGAGGSVLINADAVMLSDLSRIGASSTGRGAAGSVALVGLDGAAVTTTLEGAVLESRSSGEGSAGSVVVSSERLALSNGAQVTVLSLGSGSAGSVDISGGELALTSGSAILASVSDSAGGNVNIQVNGMVNLSDSRIAASAQGLASDDSGGNIRINAPASVTLNDSQIQANANAGAGGNIDIDTRTIVISPYSQISASSQSNVDGQIEVDAVNQITGTVLTTEAPELAQPAPLRQRCTPKDLQGRSSLVVQSAAADAVRSPYLDGGSASAQLSGCGGDSPPVSPPRS